MKKSKQEAGPKPDAKKTENRTDNKPKFEEVTNDDRRIRQAVVVIHGIGEQRPMKTLREFVDAVLVDDPAQKCKYRNKPDSMNELFETRCLQAPSDRQSRRPLTDFYEYYWAHHMQGSKYTQVLIWLWGLMRRSPGNISPALRPIFLLSWSFTIFAVALWVTAFIGANSEHIGFLEGIWRQKGLLFGGLVTVLAQWIGAHYILGYVADAARYLTPSPDNIEARNTIRSDGIKLLRTLHTSGKYARIVVVGHSLGSVIGYDIIRNLWVDLRKPNMPNPRKQEELGAFTEEAQKLDAGDVTSAGIENFQQYQHRLWQEFRQVGIPWLITDFITLGSPLAHAQFLMADNPEDCTQKKEQYEYPCCPPEGKEKPYYGQQYRSKDNGASVIRNIFIPHHGAPFSCIRWTNLYFPYRRLIMGDLIGGPLKCVFGKGIRDIAVASSTGSFIDRTVVSHIRYWTAGCSNGENSPLDTLRKVLRLDFLRDKSARKKPGVIRKERTKTNRS